MTGTARAAPAAPLSPLGDAFTHQGQLRKNGAPVNGGCNASFSLWDADSFGAQVGGTVTSATLQVTNGLFAIALDFGAGAFNGEARWLETAIGCGEAQTTLTPRTALRPAPVAFALPGLWTQQNGTSPNVIGGFSGNFITPTVVGGVIAGGGSSGYENRVLSSHATVGGGMSNAALGRYATVGGGLFNSTGSDFATSAGGFANEASGYVSSIGGGHRNIAGGYLAHIGGGSSNLAGNSFAGVGSGEGNTASGDHSTVAGGKLNTASGSGATIGGGISSTASGDWSFVGGGWANAAGGIFATVPGGTNNIAAGNYSLGAGAGARAAHQGTFVWGDATNVPIHSSGDNQFIARANGGFAFVSATSAFTPTIPAGVFITTTTGAYLSTAGVWTNANGSSRPVNIVIVAKSGGDFTTIGAALASITTNSATDRYLIYVAPGTYTETVTMKQYVDIEGAGELMTKITQVGDFDGVGTVEGASNAELRFLTVENTGGNDFAIAIRNSAASPRLTHITASASGGSAGNYGVYNGSSSPMMTDVAASASGGVASHGVINTHSSPTMKNVTAGASGGSYSNLGVYNLSSSPTMIDVTAIGSGGGANNNYGVYNSSSSPTMTNVTAVGSGGSESYGMLNVDSSPVINNSAISASGATVNVGIRTTTSGVMLVNNSAISGADSTVWNGSGATTRIGNSQLSGGAVSNSGTLTCIGVYDENYASAGYTTCP